MSGANHAPRAAHTPAGGIPAGARPLDGQPPTTGAEKRPSTVAAQESGGMWRQAGTKRRGCGRSACATPLLSRRVPMPADRSDAETGPMRAHGDAAHPAGAARRPSGHRDQAAMPNGHRTGTGPSSPVGSSHACRSSDHLFVSTTSRGAARRRTGCVHHDLRRGRNPAHLRHPDDFRRFLHHDCIFIYSDSPSPSSISSDR